ncbi:MAG TPA: DNA cytosine methyltransferase, partial [Flavobacteriales bacterium]|nr:DNA cytosine methyltransferase [Flavobacteriales bacterium]
ERTIRIGSLFSGIGGIELGLEYGIQNSITIWQVESNEFCRQVLKRHWPKSKIYNDVKKVGKHNLEPVDIICGGFPCQDISIAGKREGINDGAKSSLWWEMWRVVSELRPRIVVIENVSAITFSDGGGWELLHSLAQIGYSCEWIDLRASDPPFNAPHERERIFFVAYTDTSTEYDLSFNDETPRASELSCAIADTNNERLQKHTGRCSPMGKAQQLKYRSREDGGTNKDDNWKGFPIEPPLCRRDDGISDRVDRLRALGNSVVPACSRWIGKRIQESGLLRRRDASTLP